MKRTYAEQPRAFYQTARGEKLRISEVVGHDDTADDLELCAAGISQLTLNSYRSKFVPRTLSENEARRVVPSPDEQLVRIVKGRKRYFFTAIGDALLDDPSHIRAVLCLESYIPRQASAQNPTREAYPHIASLETRNGLLLEGPYRADALALLDVGLESANPQHAVSARTETANRDGLRFYGMLAMTMAQRRGVWIGSEPVLTGVPQATYFDFTHLHASQASQTFGVVKQLVQPYIPAV